MAPATSPRIFISYSHRGNGPQWKAALLRALYVFEQHHLLDVWQDGRIRVSSFWDDDIKRAMTDAQLSIVLLTNEALESEYILREEYPALRQRQRLDQLPIFPVVCEPCDWRQHDWLRATQAPNSSQPLNELNPEAQEHVFRQLATAIAEKLSAVTLAPLASTSINPPAKINLEHFPLTRNVGQREDRLIGREQELALLDLAFAQSQTALVSLIAWGGVGKSMLMQHWLQRLQRHNWYGMNRVYAWSFHSQGTKEDRQASEDLFLAHALTWFGVTYEPTVAPWEKGRLLAEAVLKEPTLLILDGIEPLQYPPGPLGGQLRALGIQRLLKDLARKETDRAKHGLCLISTREPLIDLASYQRRPNSPWGQLLRLDLTNLTPEAGAAVLHHTGARHAGVAPIAADDKELLAASREVDGHALTLNLLGRFLTRGHAGDIRQRDLVKFEEADLKIQGGTSFKMLKAFENWFDSSGDFGARQLSILRLLGLFDRPVEESSLNTLRQLPVISGLTEPLFQYAPSSTTFGIQTQSLPTQDWNVALSFLNDFGLITLIHDLEDQERQLDCHPLIREYFAEQLRSHHYHASVTAHSRLFDYFSRSAVPQTSPSLKELQPLYQAVTHGCLAERHEDARLQIFWNRILQMDKQYSWRHLGAWSEDLAALAGMYEHCWDQPSKQLPPYSKALVFGQAAICLLAVGRLQEAIAPLQQSAQLMRDQQIWSQAAIASGNLSELQLTLGNLQEALRLAQAAVSDAKRGNDLPQFITRKTQEGTCLFEMGQIDEAEDCFLDAEPLMVKFGISPPLLLGVPCFAFCDSRLADVERLAWRAFLTKLQPLHRPDASAETNAANDEYWVGDCQDAELRAQHSLNRLRGRAGFLEDALDRLTLARISLYRALLGEKQQQASAASMLQQSQTWLLESTTSFHRANQDQRLPLHYLTIAWLHFINGKYDQSIAALNEAWERAERSPMKLHLADIHLYRARLFFQVTPYPWQSCRLDLSTARQLIKQCGYWRRKEELEDAEQAIIKT